MSAIVLHGKHALITGGGRGIGLAIAQSLARRGVRLSLLSRTITQKEVRAAGIKDFITLKYDVSDEAAVREAFHLARGRHGTVDILVNNAGVASGAPFTLTERKMWDRV
ncbi:MAG: SDR family oxidoreductase, partial [Candidatus Eremiobacteraeota bacterium]|nr:SDR family oxidoreductase [Candidatus Eremiobacteraeota bacterium]